MSTSTISKLNSARAGDWVETRGIHGQRSRRREIIEMLGRDRHHRWRARWDEQHESIPFPADGVILIPAHQRPTHR